MVDLGSAVLLAGVLFFLERRFVRNVEVVATRVATTTADSRIDEQSQRTAGKFEELSRRMDDLVRERSSRQDSAIEALENPTFRSVATALAEANKLNAFPFGEIAVQASRDWAEMRLAFSWVSHAGDGRFGIPAGPRLQIRGLLPHKPGVPYVSIGTTWTAGDATEDVGDRLRQQLEQAGRWEGAQTFDWLKTLDNLSRSIEIAIRSRRRDSDGWRLAGALFELVGDDWAITDGGLECPPREFRLDPSAFPSRPAKMGSLKYDWEPEAPPWVSSDLWHELTRRCVSYFPVEKGPAAMTVSVPLTEGPEE